MTQVYDDGTNPHGFHLNFGDADGDVGVADIQDIYENEPPARADLQGSVYVPGDLMVGGNIFVETNDEDDDLTDAEDDLHMANLALIREAEEVKTRAADLLVEGVVAANAGLSGVYLHELEDEDEICGMVLVVNNKRYDAKRFLKDAIRTLESGQYDQK